MTFTLFQHKPTQIRNPFESPDKRKLVQLVRRKELEGWEMIRPIYSEVRPNAGNEQLVYIAPMKFVGRKGVV